MRLEEDGQWFCWCNVFSEVISCLWTDDRKSSATPTIDSLLKVKQAYKGQILMQEFLKSAHSKLRIPSRLWHRALLRHIDYSLAVLTQTARCFMRERLVKATNGYVIGLQYGVIACNAVTVTAVYTNSMRSLILPSATADISKHRVIAAISTGWLRQGSTSHYWSFRGGDIFSRPY